MRARVELQKAAQKGLQRAPKQIRTKFRVWVGSVLEDGLQETRKRPGWHDEPLKGERAGQRSVRLNRTWRAIYEVDQAGDVELVMVEEVTPHEY